jgi:hypothetical protein
MDKLQRFGVPVVFVILMLVGTMEWSEQSLLLGNEITFVASLQKEMVANAEQDSVSSYQPAVPPHKEREVVVFVAVTDVHPRCFINSFSVPARVPTENRGREGIIRNAGA